MTPAVPWRVVPDGLLLCVRLTPKGGRDAVEGATALADGSVVLKARVQAVAENGAANRALIALLADALRLAPSRLALASGHTARIKDIHIAGDGAALAALLVAAFQQGETA